MRILSKKFLVTTMLICLCSLSTQRVVADDNATLFRKIGGGACFVAAIGSLSRIAHKPLGSIGSFCCFSLLGLGIICSDILNQKLIEFVKNNRQEKQSPSLWGSVLNLGRTIQNAGRTAQHKAMNPIIAAAARQTQWESMEESFDEGDFLGAIVKGVDAAYYTVRYHCYRLFGDTVLDS